MWGFARFPALGTFCSQPTQAFYFSARITVTLAYRTCSARIITMLFTLGVLPLSVRACRTGHPSCPAGFEPVYSVKYSLRQQQDLNLYNISIGQLSKLLWYRYTMLANMRLINYLWWLPFHTQVHSPTIITSSAFSVTHRLSQSRCCLISTDKVFTVILLRYCITAIR